MKIIDISSIGSSSLYQWDRDYLFKVLATGKNPVIKDTKIMRAFKELDRKDFVTAELKDKAYMDQDLDIGYGETFTRPTILAQMMEHLRPRHGGRYLDIGTGTGFFAMALGYIVGNQGVVFSIERIQWLWELARQNSTKYKDIMNVRFLYRDGMKGLPEHGPFDGIHMSFALDQVPQDLISQLVDGGRLILPTTSHDIRVVEKMGDEIIEEVIPGFVFRKGQEGIV